MRNHIRAKCPSGFSRLFAILAIFPAIFLLATCSGLPPSWSSSSGKNNVIDVKTENDVKKLRETESRLKITPASVKDNPDYKIIDTVAIPNIPAYRIGAGDVLEVVYHIKYEKTSEPYRLEVQDRISVNFPYNPQFSTSGLVRTDGKITLPLVGEIQVVGLTVEDLAKDINKRYSKYTQNLSATVSLEEFNVKIDELKKAITTAPRGQSKVAPVAPDGRVGFPIIGNLEAAGFTVSQLEEIINKKYSQYVRNLQVTLILLEIHHNKLYIFGEVNVPGIYEMHSQFTLLQAITQAGGFKPSANLQDVLVFRNSGLTSPVVYRVNLQNMMNSGQLYGELMMQAADVIYVPKSAIDDLNDLIAKIFTKGIYAIVPFQSNFTATYDLTPLKTASSLINPAAIATPTTTTTP